MSTKSAKELLNDELTFKELCIDYFLENDKIGTGFFNGSELQVMLDNFVKIHKLNIDKNYINKVTQTQNKNADGRMSYYEFQDAVKELLKMIS